MEGIEDLQYLADFAEGRTLQQYQVSAWILVTPIPPEVTLGRVAGLISVPAGKRRSTEETERRRSIFRRLVENQTVRLFSTLPQLQTAVGTDSFLVIFLGTAFVLQVYE
jgi:hypothetical protein